MCGIAGVFSPAGNITREDVAAAARMTSAQFHRGPDDSGAFDDPHIALGHRRLSIIDLSPAGRQPLGNEDQTVRVVCNGEIYNYRDLTRELAASGHAFRSASDCEVLVHGYEQWGLEGLLGRLRGMYAFVLYDSRRACCYAVRDRLGIKPLYYSWTGDPEGAGRFVFASEVKAITGSGLVPAATDPEAVAGFLLLGSVPHPATWRRNVRCLEPGTWAEISRAGQRSRRYWSPGGISAGAEESSPPGRDPSGALAAAVRRHLISDAPLGVFLSGGVDSTGLLALARREGIRARTVTVVFDETDYNEETAAAAARYGSDHSQVRVTEQDFLREIPRVLAAMDQPASDGVNTFFVSQAASAAGLKTVLSGLGADEVFLGYRHYHWLAKYQRELRFFGRLPGFMRRAMAGAAADAGAATGRHGWTRLREIARATPQSVYLALRGFFAPEVVARLTGNAVSKTRGLLAEAAEDARNPAGFADLAAFRMMELDRYLHDQLLRDADVFGMACSLEIRVPYLDHEVVEEALREPVARHLRPGVNKPALVDAIHDEGVLAAARRPKAGFTLPLDRWMRRHSAELRERALGAELDRGEIGRLWTSFERGHMNAARAWALVVMGSLRDGGSN